MSLGERPRATVGPMKAFDISLIPCDDTLAESFMELDSVAHPSVPDWTEKGVGGVLGDARCPVERYFLARSASDIIGGFRILPLHMRVSERPDGWIQVGGLGRLCVYPHFRRLGFAGGVMRLVLQQAWAQGDVLSLLYPSSFAIYRKYGYGIAAHHVLYTVEPRAFRDDPGRSRIHQASADDWEAINHCYEHQLLGSHGIIRRSQEVWREHYLSRSHEHGFTHWLYEGEERPEGYISARYEQTDKFYIQRLHVLEWFVSTHAALRAFLGFLSAQAANVELVKLPTPVSYGLEAALLEPVWTGDPDLLPWHQPVGKLCSTLMGRIVHLREAIAARDFAADGSVNLLVEDWCLPDNSGYYRLQTREGRGQLSAATEGDPDVRLDISVLSSLYCGALTARQALMYGLLAAPGEAVDQLDAMLGRSAFMVWDYF